jgi:Short C-terminal domain
MFGRKGKKDEDEVGLAGLGTGGVDPAIAATGGVDPAIGPTPTVSVTANPSPTSPGPPPTSPATAQPAPTTAFGAGMVPPNAAAILGQILSGHGPVGELVQQIKADPEGFRQRMLAQAQAAGVSTTIMSPNWIAAPGGGAPQAGHVDVVDELTKAADLHSKGVLTDAEFEALKKKLLGE